MNENERWYLALTSLWAARLRAEGPAGIERDPAPDVDFALDVLGLRAGARVLDLACAWGRTTLELARRGFTVTGFDLSSELLAVARVRAAATGLDVPFVQGTVRLLPDLGRFDAVTAFYDDSLLSFADEADNRAALLGVARLLRPGGSLLFGTTDCPLIIAPYQRQKREEAGIRIVEEITFDAATRTGISIRTHHRPDGRVETYRRTRRHYTLDEARALLAAAGLSLCAAWCAYDHALPYGSRAEGMVLLAVRAMAMGNGQ
jgi:2-polyprenyl-3-methyl-5-hydroxy-6-metoxy-1,4-benzoquinol methylase